LVYSLEGRACKGLGALGSAILPCMRQSQSVGGKNHGNVKDTEMKEDEYHSLSPEVLTTP